MYLSVIVPPHYFDEACGCDLCLAVCADLNEMADSRRSMQSSATEGAA